MKLLLSFILLTLSVSAQQQNTIYDDNVPFNNSATTNFTCIECGSGAGSLVFGPVKGIGQAYHQFNVIVTSTTGHTCLNPGQSNTNTLFVEVIGSYSPSVAAGAQTVQIPGISYVAGANGAILTMYVQAIGAFPYVYARVGNNGSTTNCAFKVQYSGSLFPINPIHEYQLTQNVNLVTASAGDNVLVGPSVLAGTAYNILQLTLSNKTAAQTVTIFCGGSAGTVMAQFDNLVAGQVIVIPYSEFGIMKTCPSINATGITVNLLNATEVAVNAQVAFTGNPAYVLP